MKGYMYILECSDGSYYTGSTNNLEMRIQQHQNGEGANHTKKRLPVKLMYFEEYYRIDHAFLREKQVQGWGRKKKEALIRGEHDALPGLARNYTQIGGTVPSTVSTGSTASGTDLHDRGSSTVPSTGSGTDGYSEESGRNNRSFESAKSGKLVMNKEALPIPTDVRKYPTVTEPVEGTTTKNPGR